MLVEIVTPTAEQLEILENILSDEKIKPGDLIPDTTCVYLVSKLDAAKEIVLATIGENKIIQHWTRKQITLQTIYADEIEVLKKIL